MSPLITVEEALKQLHISRRVLSDLVAKHKIGHVRLGKRLYFHQAEDVEAFIERRHVAAGEAE